MGIPADNLNEPIDIPPDVGFAEADNKVSQPQVTGAEQAQGAVVEFFDIPPDAGTKVKGAADSSNLGPADTKAQPTEESLSTMRKDVSKVKDSTLPKTSSSEIKRVGDQVHFSRERRVDTAFQKIKETFVHNLIMTLSKKFFPLYFKNEKNKALDQKYAKIESEHATLKEQQRELEGKIKAKKEGIEALLSETNPSTNALNSHQLELENLTRQAEEIDQRIGKLEVNLYSTKELKKQIKAHGDDEPNAEIDHLKDLQDRRNHLTSKEINAIDADRKNLMKFRELREKGELTRQSLVAIGGERMNLTTNDGAKLDGVFLDASQFRQKLADAGGQFITFESNDQPPLNGIAFDFEKWKGQKDHIVNVLTSLNAIDFDDSQIAGWTPVLYDPGETGQKQVVLVPTQALPFNAKDHDWMEELEGHEPFKYQIDAEQASSSPTFKEISTESSGGTVILSHGSHGVYEQYKDEAAAFLFQGMNVVLFNYRGIGLSEGQPSDKNYKKDIETVYAFAKARTQHPDSKILFKGLCFGGGPSAHAAGMFPDTHLFLDQTYSSFRDIVRETARNKMAEKFDEFRDESSGFVAELAAKASIWLEDSLTSIVSKCASLLAPDFQVAQDISKNRGHKVILYIHNDSVIPLENVEKNIVAAQKGENRVKVIATPGKHADDWYSTEAAGTEIYGDISKAIEDIYDRYGGNLRGLEFDRRDIEKKAASARKEIKKLTSKRRAKEKELSELMKTAKTQGSNDEIRSKAKEISAETKQLKDRIKELKQELKNCDEEKIRIDKEYIALSDEQDREIENKYKEFGLDPDVMSDKIASDHYHAANEVVSFLADAHLSDPIL